MMGVKRRNDYGTVSGPVIISDKDTEQILHYSDVQEKPSDNDIVNAGIYYISTQIYQEFEAKQAMLAEEEKMAQNDVEGAKPEEDEFDIETADL